MKEELVCGKLNGQHKHCLRVSAKSGSTRDKLGGSVRLSKIGLRSLQGSLRNFNFTVSIAEISLVAFE